MHQLQVHTADRFGFTDITAQVQQLVTGSGVREGLCVLFCPHTTAGLTLNENWDADVRHDMTRALHDLVPARRDFRHAEGNSPAHILASLVGASQTLIVSQGRLVLGTWQGVYLAEFDGPRSRTVHVQLIAG
jgi:secondary thiamine-phosphate synthase enzyme